MCSILWYKNILPDVRETWNLECTFLNPASLSYKFHVDVSIFLGATLKKNKKIIILQYFTVWRHTSWWPGKLKLGFSFPLVCPCIISYHCIDFWGSQAQKGTRNCNFAVFYSIKTDFLMSERLEIWNVRYLPPLVCP